MTDRTVDRRRVLAATVAVGTAGFGGCLTLRPTVSADVGGSRVFDSITVSEPWASIRVRAKVKLTPEATTERGVSDLNVIAASGSTFWTGSVDVGQTSVSTVQLPTNQTSTIFAITSSGSVVERLEVTAGGDRVA